MVTHGIFITIKYLALKLTQISPFSLHMAGKRRTKEERKKTRTLGGKIEEKVWDFKGLS
ncbi:Uncharacterized protein TCM_043412 [Theobroma cacao]|uniref:Uncharacterized protein n=1 Tax=Theobroma cacao TaxID=3641 RepID=A0A061FP99_THECC|nr:Uncharacterized protein TCM_043412 [Theobroma cacao]